MIGIFTCILAGINQAWAFVRGAVTMKSITKIACVAAAMIVMCAQAYAGSMENARRLVDALGLDEQLEQTITQSITEAKQELNAGGQANVDLINQVAAALEAEMRASSPALLDELAQIYADRFTDPELDELVEFYESPTGQKYLAVESSLVAAQANAVEQWMKGVSQRAMARLFSS